jgi:histidinol-phosphatase (PHP family)
VLKTGFEVDYIPDEERRIAKLLDEYDLDYVLGSVHQVNGVNIASGHTGANQFFKNRTPTEAIEDYYQHMKLAVESEIFDTISHPDYFRKFQAIPTEWNEYGDTVLSVIDAMKSYGVGYEINTSGYRHGIDDKFPRDEFIQAAYAAGVKNVTLGSDSHYCDTIGYGIMDAAKLLKRMGYKTVSTYNARRENIISIDKVLSF